MTFVTTFALAIGLLVAIPYFAHRLRRRLAQERSFAAARLVPPSPPKARSRAKLEDRALFGVRAFSVLMLAVLGASPLVRCSRLSLDRSGGASVALSIVVDDSMSMRATLDHGTKLARAKAGARELLASTREGDAVAVVLAGAPARVALAATTDLSAVRIAIDAIEESDRATDLDGAITIARGLLEQLPQVDRRVVVLSDLADGHHDGAPLGQGGSLPVWVALPELRAPVADCAILLADRNGARVRVRLQCSPGTTPAGREISLFAGDKAIAHAPATASESSDVSLTLPTDEPLELVARLSGSDAIASDDAAYVVTEAGPRSIAVVVDATSEAVATGGAPILEQALAALRLDISVRPIPAPPDRLADLTPFAGIILDDPPGLTPEERRALASFVDQGGLVLLALGPHAASAPLGASFEPILGATSGRAIEWSATKETGARVANGSIVLAEGAESLANLGAKERAVLSADDANGLESLVTWTDGAPLIARRTMGRGEAWVVTLPFSADVSDLPLRPAFLTMLDAWVAATRERAAPRRGDVGVPWVFAGARAIAIEGPAGNVQVARDGALARAVPSRIGPYRLTIDGKKELRVAAPIARELDTRPRPVAEQSSGALLGDTHASVDVSWIVALALLTALTAEIGLRAYTRATAR